MNDENIYTHALWRVKPGEEKAFVAAWDDLAEAFSSLPAQPLWGTLLRSNPNPSVFYSFGEWRSLADIQAMRADPGAQAAVERARSYCMEATPEPCDLVRHVRIRNADSPGLDPA